jgi:hypothetical protein
MIYSTLSAGENLGGLRLIRGYDQVQRLNNVQTKQTKSIKKSRSAGSGFGSNGIPSSDSADRLVSVSDRSVTVTVNTSQKDGKPVRKPSVDEIKRSLEKMDVEEQLTPSDSEPKNEQDVTLWMQRMSNVKHLVFVVHG